MKSLLLSWLKRRKTFVVYCLIGVTGVALDYCSFYAMVNWLGIYYLLANAISTSLGILNNFFLNCFLNFKVQDRWLGWLASFYCIGLMGLAVSSVILFVMVARMGVNPNYSKLAALIVVVLLQDQPQPHDLISKIASVTNPKNHRAVIIGGGFTGLTAAYRLARAGWSRLTLIERGSSLGGLAGDFGLQGTRIEKTYHHLFRTDRAILDLVDELGLHDRLMWRQSSLGIFYQGRVYPFMSPRDVLAFAPCSLLNRVRLGFVALYLQKKKNWRPLCRWTAHEWMARACGKQAMQVVWEPLLRGKFHRHFDSVSMAWLWARIHTRANSRDKAASEKLGYFQGGFAVVTAKLESELVRAGVTIRKNTAVQEIKNADGRPALLIDGKLELFDRCIFTGPSAAFADLLPKDDAALASYRQRLYSIDYLGAISLVFVSGQEIGDYYWLNINQTDAPFLVFIRHTKMVDKALYGSKEVYYIGSYQPHDSPLFAMTNAEIVDLWFGFLRTIYPRFDPAQAIEKHVFKLRYAQHIVDTTYQSKIPAYHTPLQGVYLANFSQVFPDDRGTNFAVREGNRIASLLDGGPNETTGGAG